MSHEPPVPPAATPPYPPHPAPIERTNVATKVAATSSEVARAASSRTGVAIAVGAAVGIGSAAIAAALLFAGNRGKN